MCGIVGLWTEGGCDMQAVVRRMNAQIGHRGPDDEGYHCDRGMWFGVRRLSIIDPVAGAQPMSTAHGGHHIVYNGELYNYRELRAELEAAGVEFIPENGGGAGVRLRKRTGPTDEGLRPDQLTSENVD